VAREEQQFLAPYHQACRGTICPTPTDAWLCFEVCGGGCGLFVAGGGGVGEFDGGFEVVFVGGGEVER
jgi:hypothetical protein